MTQPLPTLNHLPAVAASGKISIGAIRREQIVEAAVNIIVTQGLPKLSLSKIEDAARMKRGQLTYYFRTKEDILLAVFDRLLLMMYHRIEATDGHPGKDPHHPEMWVCIQKMLQAVLGPKPLDPEFNALQYTFLAQSAHREDFRHRLASLYEEWRTKMANHWQLSAEPALEVAKTTSPRVIASFVQALVHGLIMQMSADPNAFDRREMLALCVGVLAPLFIPVPLDASTRPRRAGQPRRSKEDSRE